MEVTIRLTKAIARHFTDDNKIIRWKLQEKDYLVSVIAALDKRFPGLKGVLQGEDGDIFDGINIYVNGENVRYLAGWNTPLKHADVISIIPAAAAG